MSEIGKHKNKIVFFQICLLMDIAKFLKNYYIWDQPQFFEQYCQYFGEDDQIVALSYNNIVNTN